MRWDFDNVKVYTNSGLTIGYNMNLLFFGQLVLTLSSLLGGHTVLYTHVVSPSSYCIPEMEA